MGFVGRPKHSTIFCRKRSVGYETQPRCARHEAQRSERRLASVWMEAVTQPQPVGLHKRPAPQPGALLFSSCLWDGFRRVHAGDRFMQASAAAFGRLSRQRRASSAVMIVRVAIFLAVNLPDLISSRVFVRPISCASKTLNRERSAILQFGPMGIHFISSVWRTRAGSYETHLGEDRRG